MDGYTNDELRSISGESWPTRGAFCEKCETRIPVFADLTAEQEESLRAVAEESPGKAMKEIRRLTGCSPRWAKIWVAHPNGPQPRFNGPPCPYCGETLRTDKAKQCLSCGMDWHDLEHVVRHGH